MTSQGWTIMIHTISSLKGHSVPSQTSTALKNRMSSKAAILFLVTQLLCLTTAIAQSSIQAHDLQDGRCHCETNMTINIPACVCTDVVGTVAENLRLRAQVQDLKQNCTTVNLMELPLLCELLLVYFVAWY